MYTIQFNNGMTETRENIKAARYTAWQFFRMAKNRRYGLHLNFYTCAAIYKAEKMVYSVNNKGIEYFYKWNA